MKGLAAVGDVLAGKYRVDQILGIGGMGMVVAATHLEIDQPVALKFMLPNSHDSADSSARFLREARAAGRLNSEHVCRVMDVGRFDSGAPYIVMEYLQGENLGARLRRKGPFSVSDAVDFMLQGIEGLAEAHAHGIIHRDLKPDNLFVHKRNDGNRIVKVLDFGISKISIEGLSTKTGDIMGSPAYMAPEQMESTRNVDHRADVWSLGVVLYQLVTGKSPFVGDTLPLLCMAVVNDDPVPMRELRADLPEGYEAVVMRCLCKEPGDRYADVGELARELAPFGPKNAATSAARIQIVLRRTHKDSVQDISTDFSMVPPEDLVDLPPLPKPPLPPGPVIRMPTSQPREATTYTSAGQTMSTARVERPSGRGFLLAAIIAAGAAALIIVALWHGGSGIESSASAQDPAPPKPTATAHPTGPIVEPIIEDPGPGSDKQAAAVPAADPKQIEVDPPAPTPVHTVAHDDAPADPPHKPATKPDPHRHPGNPGIAKHHPGNHPRPTAGGTDATDPPPNTGSNAGSGDDDDDKWTHMTHDEKSK